MPASQIRELRQAGRLDEALSMAKAELDATPDNIWAKRNISWVFYGYISRCESALNWDTFLKNIRAIENLHLPAGEEMLFDNVAWKIGKMVYSISREDNIDPVIVHPLIKSISAFGFTKPSESYSFLLKGVHKVLKNNERYNDFVDWWDLKNLRVEDYENEQLPNGKDAMSLAEMVYSAYSKNLLPKSNNIGQMQFNKDKALAFLPVLTEVDEKHPKFQYVSYYRAKLLLAVGETDNTLPAFLPFARRKSKDFWVWDLLGEVVKNDQDKMLACYCKGLSCNSPKEMLTNLRTRLCRLLIARKLYKEAKTEIEEIVRVRIANGFSIPAEIINWQREDWYKTATATNSNKQYYKQHFNQAEQLLYSDIPEEIVIVDRISSDSKILNYFTDQKQSGYFKYEKYIDSVRAGDVLEVRFKPRGDSKFEQVYTVRISNNEAFRARYIRAIEGIIRIGEGNPFGFIEDIYVHPSIVTLKGLKNGDHTRGKAIRKFDVQRNKWTWILI